MNNCSPIFSIITPCYNSEKYIQECITSVLNQNFKDFEFIIVDDGSSDSSKEIIKNFLKNDNRIKFYSKENQGQGVQRNFALKEAKGKYVLMLDSDDWLEENALEKLFNKFQEDETDIILFNGFKFFQDENLKIPYNYINVFYKRFQERSFAPLVEAQDILFKINGYTFKAYKREFLIKNNIKYSSTRFVEDGEFYIKAMLCAEKISCLKENILNYRIYPASTTYTRTGRIEDIKYSYNVCKEILKNSPYGENKNILKSFIKNRLRQLFHYYQIASKTNFSTKKKYYGLIKEILKEIKEEFGFSFIEKKTVLIKYNDIIKYPYEFYRFKRGLFLSLFLFRQYFEI